jgi:hypothetical protein
VNVHRIHTFIHETAGLAIVGTDLTFPALDPPYALGQASGRCSIHCDKSHPLCTPTSLATTATWFSFLNDDKEASHGG